MQISDIKVGDVYEWGAGACFIERKTKYWITFIVRNPTGTFRYKSRPDVFLPSLELALREDDAVIH